MQENPLWKQIEAYIQKNREVLDVDRPSDDLWDRISHELHDKAPRRLWWQENALWRVAAAIALVATLSYLWYIRLGNGKLEGVRTDLVEQADKLTHTEAASLDTWTQVDSAYRMEDAPASVPDAAAGAVERLEAQIDSLKQAGEPTAARIEYYERLVEQRKMLLTPVPQP